MASNNNSSSSNKQSVVHDLLSRAHSPDSTSRIFADKIQHRPLFVKPSSPPPPDARDARRRARREKQQQRRAPRAPKPQPLTARQRRALGLHDVPRKGEGCRYATFEPLHRLWRGYVREILSGGEELHTGGQGAAAKLCAADYHGARVEVVRSRCPSRVGLRGIVVKDARFVFEIVTERDQVKVVPKEGTVFRFDVPVVDEDEGEETNKNEKEGERNDDGGGDDGHDRWKRKTFTFEVHGDQFQHRSADRTNKKFKAHFLKNL
ncbi:hypothetical protein SLS62_008407 [Diatrype stigma]|uniref:Ribonuclease P protein subunit n=1 Tax=Diatrype stigma TaxID=117547 RepID=A0AAN9YP01_9PEZI